MRDVRDVAVRRALRALDFLGGAAAIFGIAFAVYCLIQATWIGLGSVLRLP